MNCGNCGRVNPSSALYCLDCGQRLRDNSPVAPSAAIAVPSSASPTVGAPAPGPVAAPAPGLPCGRCGADNPPGMRFCRMCGSSMQAPEAPASAAPAKIRCGQCSAHLDPGAAFCGVCGARVGAPAPPASAAPPPPAPAPAPPVSAPPPAPSAPRPVADAGVIGGGVAAPVAPREELHTDSFGAEAPSLGPRLVTILKDGSEGPIYRLQPGTTDIGRSEGNILLPDDPYLSPRHARLSMRSGRYYLRDLGTVNGIFYRVREPMSLQHGDTLLVGQQLLRLEMLSDGEISFGPVMNQGIMLFGTPELPRAARLVQLTTEGVPRDIYYLHREETVIGREQGDIVFTDDPFLSRRHASLRLDRAQKRVALRDLGSSNGTLVQYRGEREVSAGDFFRIGHHLFRFDAPRPPAAAHAPGGQGSR